MEGGENKLTTILSRKVLGYDMKIVLMVSAVIVAVIVGSGYFALQKTGGVSSFVSLVKESKGNPMVMLEGFRDKKKDKFLDDLKI